MISRCIVLRRNVKLVLVAFTFFLFQNVISQNTIIDSDPRKTSEILEEAYALAEKENKNVMIVFTASWCKWCKRMIQNMNDYKCDELFKNNYVIRTLVVKESKRNKHLENPGANELLVKYRAEKSGIPYFLIFNAKGKLLAKSENDEGINLGCPASKKEVSKFKEILKSTSNLTDKELAIVGEKFLLEKK